LWAAKKKGGDCNTTFWNETISRWAACFLGLSIYSLLFFLS
jgi:endonuclease/exonuclease/phosphatase (EEP) superfamily protein YafD